MTGSSVVFTTIAALAVVGPLLGLMSFSLVATVTLFLKFSPLMLKFAPVLIVVAAMISVGVAAAAMWSVGIAALVCCRRDIGVGTRVAERMVESIVRVMVRESLLAKQGCFYFSSFLVTHHPSSNLENASFFSQAY